MCKVRTSSFTIDPKRTAMLVLHMMNEQLKFKPGASFHGPEFPESNRRLAIIEHTRSVLAASRRKRIPVIYVRIAYRPGYPEIPLTEELIPGRRPTRQHGHYKEGSWNTQIVEELKPRRTDIVVTNHTPSAFGHNDLDAILRAQNIRYLVMAGLSTRTIVTCTAIDAYCRGYYNYILEDCCNSRKPGEHELYMKEVLPSYAVIINSKQYIRTLTGTI